KPLLGKVIYSKLKQLKYYAPIFNVNRYLFVRTIFLLFAMSFFTAQGAKLGADILAANAVLMTFVMLISHVLDGFAHAIEALTGKAIGEKDLDKLYKLVIAAAVFSVITAMFFSLFFYLSGELIIDLLTSIEAVRFNAKEYLVWVWLLPLIAVTSYLLDGLFIGTTQVKVMQNAMLVSVFAIYFPVWFFTQPWLNHGLWITLLAFYLGRALTSCYAFYWLSKHNKWFKA
ncbi:MAG: MATE family multidrug resistance protein, partial [Oceanospirillaceae bacterium]